MYFEDNEVYIAQRRTAARTGNNPWIAPINGARVVIRHNKIVNAELEIYGPGHEQAVRLPERRDLRQPVSTVDGGTPQCIIFIAAGVAIVFNNTVTGTPTICRIIELTNQRACHGHAPLSARPTASNPLDGNQIPAGQLGAGYPCFGQVGWATNVDGIFKPSPCYAWNNTLNGEKLLMAVSHRDPNEAATIKEGRDSSTRSRRRNTTSPTSIRIRCKRAGKR